MVTKQVSSVAGIFAFRHFAATKSTTDLGGKRDKSSIAGVFVHSNEAAKRFNGLYFEKHDYNKIK